MAARHTGRRPLFSPHVLLVALACVLFLSAALVPAQAAPPEAIDRHLASWGAKNGAPAMVLTIAQTSDGWLWLGGPNGLFRFDGVRFERYAEAGAPLPANGISILTAQPSGELWIGYRFGGASRLAQGKLRNYDERDGLPKNMAVWGLERDGAGRMWAATTRGMFYLQNERWQAAGADWGLTSTTFKTLMRDRHGTLWVQGDSGIHTLAPGATRFGKLPVDSGIGVLAEVRDGSIWSWDARDNRLRRLTRPAAGATARRWQLRGEVGTLLFDREGNLWAGRDDGVEYHDARGITQTGPRQGLSGGLVSALFEDREGSIWAATASGIDRFRPRRVARVMVPEKLGSQTLTADDAGGVWSGRYHVARPDRPAAPALALWPAAKQAWQNQVSSTYRDRAGVLWAGGYSGLRRIDGASVTRMALPPGIAGGQFNAIAHDRQDRLWISIALHGVYRLRPDGAWGKRDGVDGLPDEPARVMTVAPNRDLWIGYPRSRLLLQAADGWHSFGPADGLGLGMVMALHVRAGHIWAGGENGLALRRGSRFIAVSGGDGQTFAGVTGIVELDNGDLWINALAGLFRIPAAAVASLAAGATQRVAYERLDGLDGVEGNAPLLLPTPSLVLASDNQLWLATTIGVHRFDPAARPAPQPAPPVLIRRIGPPGQAQAALPGLRLAPGSATLQIDYTAMALALPERVRFRYRLDGIDTAWQDAGRRRTAFYNNLGAGDYHFRVQASNYEGEWGTRDSSLDFSIAPTAFQTWWFKLLCALAVLAAGAMAYRWRLRRLVAQMAGRLDERVQERERIARELHDTLLQSVQGLILNVHAAALHLPAREPVRARIEEALAHADDVLHEGRDRVRDLRSQDSCEQSLAAALTEADAHLCPPGCTRMRLNVTGKVRKLHPALHQEALAIACEAIANAYHHAQASAIDVQLSYRAKALHLCIRDNGAGIPPQVLAAGGRADHWGLSGMRERAARIKAKLSLHSDAAGGTVWTLVVPGSLAYLRRPRRLWLLRSG